MSWVWYRNQVFLGTLSKSHHRLMPKLRILSGEDVVNFLKALVFVTEKQRGSHVKLKKYLL
jgi:hypothetical protein